MSSLLILNLMFVKRLNKIYTPPIIETVHKHRQFNSDRNKQSISIIPANLSKQYDDSRFDKQLKVFMMSIDPHGRYICFYSELHDEVYIISIVTLLDHVDKFRRDYTSDFKYSFKTSLKPEVIIKNPRNSLNIFQIKFSHSLQNTQFLIIVYYSGLIDMYSVLSGKKIDTFNLLDRSQVSIQQASMSPLFNANVIGHSIFISTYDGKLYCYEGRQLSLCSKYSEQWVRVGYDDGIQSFSKQEQETQNKKTNNQNRRKERKNKKVPLYYTFNGELKAGEKVIQKGIDSKQKVKKVLEYLRKNMNLDEQQQNQQKLQKVMSESYEEYIRLQFDKVSASGFHMQYSLSLCERFIICKKQMDKHIQEKNKRSVYYSIRSRERKWSLFESAKFYNYPAINQFWGINFNEKASKTSKQGDQSQNFIKYCINSDSILIAVIGYYECEKIHRRKIQKLGHITKQIQQNEEKTITILRLNRLKNNYKVSIVCKVTDVKHHAIMISWIGPNILTYLDEAGNVYYMEVEPQILMQ